MTTTTPATTHLTSVLDCVGRAPQPGAAVVTPRLLLVATDAATRYPAYVALAQVAEVRREDKSELAEERRLLRASLANKADAPRLARRRVASGPTRAVHVWGLSMVAPRSDPESAQVVIDRARRARAPVVLVDDSGGRPWTWDQAWTNAVIPRESPPTSQTWDQWQPCDRIRIHERTIPLRASVEALRSAALAGSITVDAGDLADELRDAVERDDLTHVLVRLVATAVQLVDEDNGPMVAEQPQGRSAWAVVVSPPDRLGDALDDGPPAGGWPR